MYDDDDDDDDYRGGAGADLLGQDPPDGEQAQGTPPRMGHSTLSTKNI
jgi:hypothetical protein